MKKTEIKEQLHQKMEILGRIENLHANKQENEALRILCKHKEDQPDTLLEILQQLRLRSNYF